MRARQTRITWLLVCCAGVLSFAGPAPRAIAQTASAPEYLNTNLPAEVRAKDLVGRMTLAEKASQLVNQARAIPGLKVTAYDWWSGALHGVAVDGTTEFAEPIGLGATFDPAGIHAMAWTSAPKVESYMLRRCVMEIRRSFMVSTSGLPTSTSSAILAGAVGRKPMAKIPS